MTHDTLMDILANTLAEEADLAGCLTVLNSFAPHPETELNVSIPVCDETAEIPLKDFVLLRDWKNLIEKSKSVTLGDLVDYLCDCTNKDISLEIPPESEGELYAALIVISYDSLPYDGQLNFWRYVLENNSLAIPEVE